MTVNFDNAATTFPKPVSVRQAAAKAISELGGNAGRGGHDLARRTSEAVYSARETAASFFGASPENTVFALNCTHALNMAIKGIMSDGGHMIISSIEHNSVSRPAYALFQQGKIDLSCADAETDPDRTVENFHSLIRSDTKAIVCTAAGNVTGQIMPLRPIARLCREKGICFIVDGAQACGVLPLTLEDGFNILCTAGHKGLYGITGTGLLISDGQFTIKPMIQGGTGSSSSLLTQPELLPEALESGTLNTPGIMSLKAGIDFVRRQGIDNIKEHEDRLCRIFIDGAKEIPGMTVYRSPGAEYVPIVSFNISSASPEKTAAMLAKQGFCLRAGYHCAALAHASLGTKQGTVRFSPSVFSREEAVHRLLRLLRSIQENRSDL